MKNYSISLNEHERMSILFKICTANIPYIYKIQHIYLYLLYNIKNRNKTKKTAKILQIAFFQKIITLKEKFSGIIFV